MNKFIAAIKQAPKRAATLAIIAAAVIVPAVSFAWGPASRPTYTAASPAPHVTFNSITDNPAHGDERNFVQIKEANASSSTYTEEIALQPGKEYQVYVYYHNNAAANLNDAAHDYKGIALNTSVRVQMPATVKAGEKARFTGIVSASNAQPKDVWDEAYGTTTSGVALRYVQGSAKLSNQGAANGSALADSIVTTGVRIGHDQLDGKIPGCNEFAGYITFRFKVVQPNFEISKLVSKSGENTYSESVAVNPGDKVDYRIMYKNTGSTEQNNVVIKDILPANVTYIAGTSYMASSASAGQYAKISDNITTATGVNIGSYAPNGNAYVKFTAQVPVAEKLTCGENILINKAVAETANGNKSDTANVTVTKICEEEPEVKDIKVCELDTKKVISIKEYQFDESKYSMDLSDCDETPVTPVTPETPEKPEVPTELPKTGAGETFAALLGLGSLITSVSYYVASQRGLIGALTNR